LFGFFSYLKNSERYLTELIYSLLFCSKKSVKNDYCCYFKCSDIEYMDTYSLIVEHKRIQNTDADLEGVFNQASISAAIILEDILQQKHNEESLYGLKDENETQLINLIPDRIPIIGWKGHEINFGFVKYSTEDDVIGKKRYTVENIKKLNLSFNSKDMDFWSNIQFGFYLTNLFCGEVSDFLMFSNIKKVKLPDRTNNNDNIQNNNNNDNIQNVTVEKKECSVSSRTRNRRSKKRGKNRGGRNRCVHNSEIIELKKRLNISETYSSNYEWISVEKRRRNKILYGFKDQDDSIEKKKIKVVGKIFRRKERLMKEIRAFEILD